MPGQGRAGQGKAEQGRPQQGGAKILHSLTREAITPAHTRAGRQSWELLQMPQAAGPQSWSGIDPKSLAAPLYIYSLCATTTKGIQACWLFTFFSLHAMPQLRQLSDMISKQGT